MVAMADNETIGSKNGQSPERAMTHTNTRSQLDEKPDSSAKFKPHITLKAEPAPPDDREYHEVEVNGDIKVKRYCAAAVALIKAGIDPTTWEATEVGDCTNIKQEIQNEITAEPAPTPEVTLLTPMSNCKMYICDICDKVYHRNTSKRATDATSLTEPTNGATIKVDPLDTIKTEPENDSKARTIDGKEFVTCKCNKIFKSETEHLTHYSELLYVCNVCSKREFVLVKGGVQTHYEVLHRLEKVTCRLCRLTFTNRSKCEASAEAPLYVLCSLCRKLYLNKTAMYKHMFYSHKKRQCELCGERIASAGALSSHFCKKGTIEMKFGGTPRQYGRSRKTF